MARILLLLDMANLWDSCREQYGKRARVNFKVLLDKAKSRKTDTVISYAFIVPVEGKNQDNLISKLKEMGINTVTLFPDGSGLVESMCVFASHEYSCKDNKFDKVVVASSNPAVKQVLISMNQANLETMLLAFAESLDKELANEADDIKLLTKADTIQQ